MNQTNFFICLFSSILFVESCSGDKEDLSYTADMETINASPPTHIGVDTLFLSYVCGMDKQQFEAASKSLRHSGIIYNNFYKFYFGKNENDYLEAEIIGKFSSGDQEWLELITLDLIGDKVALRANKDRTGMLEYIRDESPLYFDPQKIGKLLSLYNSKYGNPIIREEVDYINTYGDLERVSDTSRVSDPNPIKCKLKYYTFEDLKRHVEIRTARFITRTGSNIYTDEYRSVVITYQALDIFRQNERNKESIKDSIENSIKQKLQTTSEHI